MGTIKTVIITPGPRFGSTIRGRTPPMRCRSTSPIRNNCLFLRLHESGPQVGWISRVNELGPRFGSNLEQLRVFKAPLVDAPWGTVHKECRGWLKHQLRQIPGKSIFCQHGSIVITEYIWPQIHYNAMLYTASMCHHLHCPVTSRILFVGPFQHATVWPPGS